MFRIHHKRLKVIVFFLTLLIPAKLPAFAQTVSSDRTTNTTVTGNNPFTITEGTLRDSDTGTTLFHSFETFSPGTSKVIFDLQANQNAINTQLVTAIINRVTGQSASFIDGELTVLQDSNTPAPDLFLINPQGILFGENAKLSLPGSFLASTAESLLFREGKTFSATAPSAAPLLTVSAPIGLQFSENSSGGISLQGSGHEIATTNPTFAPYFPIGANLGLAVSQGEQLSLIGGSVNLTGGALSAPGGQVDVGSVRQGTVSLQGQSLNYEGVEQFGDIALTERSLIEVSGAIAGNVQLQGRKITLDDGSLVWNQNRGLQPSGQININATEQLLLTGTTPIADAISGIITETVGPGNAWDINITAAQLNVQEGAAISSRSFGAGNSGRLQIEAKQTVVDGYASIAPDIFSAIATTSFLTGQAGEVTVSTQDLSVTEGGYLGSSTLGSGQGGDVMVTADNIEVIGATPTFIASNIGATTAGRMGNSGNVTLQTGTLKLQDSGLISTSSIGIGNAGNISVQASESIDISGGRQNLPTSTIASTVDFPPLAFQLLLGLSGTPRGTAGDITVLTPSLTVSEGGSITVANFAEGNAGQLTINAGSILLNQGGIDAFTKDGEGGNINLNIQDVLLLRAGGSVNATAQGNGNGGNLKINSPVIIGIENSDIIASAITGNGGNINITTQGIFGLTPREQQTSESDITASSQFGLSGTVSVNGLAIQPDAALVELSEKLSDPDTQVSKSCVDQEGSQFVASGRGGFPTSPSGRLFFTQPWEDLRAIAPSANTTVTQTTATQNAYDPTESFEASHWQLNAAGQVVLASAMMKSQQTDRPDCIL